METNLLNINQFASEPKHFKRVLKDEKLTRNTQGQIRRHTNEHTLTRTNKKTDNGIAIERTNATITRSRRQRTNRRNRQKA